MNDLRRRLLRLSRNRRGWRGFPRRSLPIFCDGGGTPATTTTNAGRVRNRRRRYPILFQRRRRLLRPPVDLGRVDPHQGREVRVPLLAALGEQAQDRLLVVGQRHRTGSLLGCGL